MSAIASRPQSVGMIRVLSNTQIAEREARDRDALRAAERMQNEPAMVGLSSHIEKFWQSAQQAKRPVEQKMLRNLRQRNGIYEPTELALIREQGGSEIYMMLTSAKCRNAEAWLREILMSETDRPWSLAPSPMPDLPPPVQTAIIDAIAQEAIAAGWDPNDRRIDERLMKVKWLAMQRMKQLAQKIAERHTQKIEDQFAEGGWERALSDFIYDLVTFPAAFLKGPVIRKARDRQWRPGANGVWAPVVVDKLRPEYERRSPFDIFPAARMRNIQKGNLIDRYMYTRGDLQTLVDVPGFSNDAIYGALDAYGMKGYNSRQMNDSERALLSMRQNEQYDTEGDFETLNFWGSVPGHLLMQWQWENDVHLGGDLQPHREYQIEAWKIGRFVIGARINPSPFYEKPYSKCSLEEVAGEFWGDGIPELMRDCQGMCNSSARAIANNAAIASGPQVEVNVDRVAEGEQITQAYPWKLWQTTSDLTGNGQPAIRFSQPNMHVQELLLIFNHFERVAENATGFPNYSAGDSRATGAARTSSGLAQLMGNVGKGVRRVVAAVDRDAVKPVVTRTYDYNMQYDPDTSIKFDLHAVASGSAAILIKDQVAQRQKEILQATANPLDATIIGPKGRAVMLRQVLDSSDFKNVEKIVPDEMELELLMARMPPVHELVGRGGPNASGPQPDGVNGGGGTPEGPATTDVAGQPANGSQMRQFRDGGLVTDDLQPMTLEVGGQKRRFRFARDADGRIGAREMDAVEHLG